MVVSHAAGARDDKAHGIKSADKSDGKSKGTDKKKTRRPRRAVRAWADAAPGVHFEFFDQVASMRLRLKPAMSRTLYAVAHMIADEHDMIRQGLAAKDDSLADGKLEKRVFHRHAASALRILADRLLKSFELRSIVLAERYSGEQWAAAIAKFDSYRTTTDTLQPREPKPNGG